MELKVQNFKPITYIVRNRKGYQHNLYEHFDGNTVEFLKKVGFINTGHTLKHETFSVTNLADKYYKEVFGSISYYKQRLLGFADRIRKSK